MIEICFKVLKRWLRYDYFGHSQTLEPMALIDDLLRIPRALGPRIARHRVRFSEVEHQHRKHHFQWSAVIIGLRAHKIQTLGEFLWRRAEGRPAAAPACHAFEHIVG